MNRAASKEPIAQLSPREREVISWLAKGYSYAQIATQLDISVNTLKTHIKRAYGKLNVHNRTQAVLAAQKHHLI